MAFKLNKNQGAEFDKLLAHARDMFSQLESEIENANSMLDEIRNKLDEKKNDYNSAQEDLRAFIEDDLVADWRTEWDERSEKWQESDRGQEVSSWIDEWENLDLNEIDLEGPEDLDIPDNNLDDIESLTRDAAEV